MAKSLRRRLPLLVASLQTVVVVGIGWTAYATVRNTVLSSDATRLDAASSDVAWMLRRSLDRLRGELDSLARSGAPRSFLAQPTAAARVEALRWLRDAHAALPTYRALSLRDASGRPLLSSGSLAEDSALSLRPRATPGADGDIATPLVYVNRALVYGVVTPVLRQRDTIGFIVGMRTLDNNGSGNLIARLVGSRARFRLGTTGTREWTDLARPVHAPPTGVVRARPYVDVGGVRRIASSARVPQTPWTVWIDSPTGTALTTAHRFLVDIALASVVFLLLGALAAWAVVRRVTRPLGDLKDAAEEIAFGDYTKRVSAGADNEIGATARSFNVMAERVQLAVDALKVRADDLEQRNRALADSELRYRQLVDQSPDAIVVHRAGLVVYASGAAARLVGLDERAAMLGRAILDFVHPDDRERAAQRITALVDHSVEARLTELRLVTIDGREIVTEVSSVGIMFDGAPAVQTLARDVTQRKLLEEQINQAQKMDAVGRLAGGIAHDFNNLLTVISSYTELALAETAEHDARRSDLEEIRRATLSAADLTRQILAFGRKQVLSPHSIDVHESVNRVVCMLGRVIGENVSIRTRLHADPSGVWADPGQLEQLLLNLAVNARDAMPDGGEIEFSTGFVKLANPHAIGMAREIPPGEYVALSVSDSGVGMTTEVMNRAFEPFFTTKPQGEGTGLGLAVVYAITQQSGGYVDVTSAPGLGSRFTLYFPVHRAPAAEPSAEPAVPEATASSGRVLLVEDEPSVRSVLRRGLARAGFSVTEASSGAAALEAFDASEVSENGFDVVLTDMMMPGMSGEELIRRLQARAPDLRAVIMSGYSAETGGREWRLPPNTIFVQKPIIPRELAWRIDELLSAAR